MSWQAASWALTRAPMPKSDPAARAVLAYLGVKADGKGRNAYPLALSIAHDCGLNPEVVPRVLKRLVDYGLISKDGLGPQGQPRWVLHMDRCHAERSFDEFARRHQGGRALRQSRWRHKAAVDDDGSSTRDDDGSSTATHVDDAGSSQRRLSIVSETTMRRNVDDSEYPQISPLDQSRSVLDQSLTGAAAPGGELPLGIPAPEPVAKPNGYTPEYEAAWLAYGRRGDKRAAFAEWQKATRRAPVATITAAIPPFVASTPDLKYRKHFERWLKGDGWESAVVPARQVNGSGYRPWTNPSDQDAYDEELK